MTGTFGVADVVEHARGFKTLAEALYLREHILRQLQLAGATDDAELRRAHATFVVVGGGFAGLELAAQGAALAQAALRQERALDAGSVRWTVLEAGTSVLGQFPSRLARHALDRIRKQGRPTSVSAPRSPNWSWSGAAGHRRDSLGAHRRLDRRRYPCRRSSPSSGLPVERGRLVVDEQLRTPDHPHVSAIGDAAAVTDVTRHGRARGADRPARTAPRAAAARNVVASVGHGKARAYKHRDLGFRSTSPAATPSRRRLA